MRSHSYIKETHVCNNLFQNGLPNALNIIIHLEIIRSKLLLIILYAHLMSLFLLWLLQKIRLRRRACACVDSFTCLFACLLDCENSRPKKSQALAKNQNHVGNVPNFYFFACSVTAKVMWFRFLRLTFYPSFLLCCCSFSLYFSFSVCVWSQFLVYFIFTVSYVQSNGAKNRNPQIGRWWLNARVCLFHMKSITTLNLSIFCLEIEKKEANRNSVTKFRRKFTTHKVFAYDASTTWHNSPFRLLLCILLQCLPSRDFYLPVFAVLMIEWQWQQQQQPWKHW